MRIHNSTPLLLAALLLAGLSAVAFAEISLQPRPACDPSKMSCVSAPKKCMAQGCFTRPEAQAEFEKKNNCRFPGNAAKDCTQQWRLDMEFLKESEGRLRPDGYVPRYKDIRDKQGNIIKQGEVIGQSGVTISTGIDLGQQSASGTRKVIDAYIKDNGNPDKVDVDALMKKLDPYFELKKQKAVDALAKTPLTVTEAEARLLERAFSYDTQVRVAKQFDKKNTKDMVFKQLPEEAQTVIIDFAYQYGLNDSLGAIRRTFWKYVYDGEWQKLADWLKSKPDPYDSRRKREGVRLQEGIDSKSLPESGNPCGATSKAGP